jgi:hypothetical protein
LRRTNRDRRIYPKQLFSPDDSMKVLCLQCHRCDATQVSGVSL